MEPTSLSTTIRWEGSELLEKHFLPLVEEQLPVKSIELLNYRGYRSLEDSRPEFRLNLQSTVSRWSSNRILYIKDILEDKGGFARILRACGIVGEGSLLENMGTPMIEFTAPTHYFTLKYTFEK